MVPVPRRVMTGGEEGPEPGLGLLTNDSEAKIDSEEDREQLLYWLQVGVWREGHQNSGAMHLGAMATKR